MRKGRHRMDSVAAGTTFMFTTFIHRCESPLL
jgi:hypothetical protein